MEGGPARHRKPIEHVEEKFKAGDELKVKILKIDSIQHKIALSIKGV